MALYPPQDRLIRKEVALGTLRAIEPPTTHIGTAQIAPFMTVGSDDVIFDYAKGLTDGLAPARAEDAESDLAQKDILPAGTGRASVIDWALKDHYSASDVTRYSESVLLAQQLGGNASVTFPLTLGNAAEEFRTKVTRDDVLRRRKLDNRIEWLIMSAVDTGGITYNDGKIIFTIDYGRPANQDSQAPTSGVWTTTTFDPIGDIEAVNEYMYDTHGVRMGRVIGSRKSLNRMLNSDRFVARSGIVGATGSAPVDPKYVIDGWGPGAARAIVERACNIQFIEYDSVYRTRAVGSQTIVNNRFTNEDKLIFLPALEDLNDLDDAIGFGKTLTSPHPEGNWAASYYEWEVDTVDPWGKDRGTGIKAFPVFPHMDLTYTMTVA
jgi:hypothetical protein